MLTIRMGRKANRIASKTIGFVLTVMGLLYVSNIFKTWVYVPIIGYASVALGLTLAMVFLTKPLRKPKNEVAPEEGGVSWESYRESVPWYDLLFMALGFCSTFYVALFSDVWRSSIETGYSTSLETVLFFILALLVVEATRRTIGVTLAITTLVFLVYAPFSTGLSIERITTQMYFQPLGIVGSLVTLTFTVITMFMLFGAALQKTRAGTFIVEAAISLTGRWTGGPAKAAVISTCLLGMITGVGPANAAVTGSISIPIMKKAGYRPDFAAGVEGVAANGSAIMPPVMGIAAFIMADFLGMPYWQVCVAAFVPAFLYYWGIFIQVHLEAKKFGLLGLSPELLPVFGKVFKRGWFYIFPLLLLIYLLAVENMPTEKCGMYAAFSTLIIALIDRQVVKSTRSGSKEIVKLVGSICCDAGEMLVITAVACAGAGIIVASISASGVSFKLASWLVDIAGSNQLLLLVMVAVVSFVLGVNLPPLPCYLIMATMVAPAMIKFGILPLAAQLFCFYWGLQAEITPPVATAVYVASGIAQSNPLKSGMIAMRVGFLSFVLPFIFVYHNSLLLIGPVWKIVFDIGSAAIAIIFIGAGFEGFLLKQTTIYERVLFIVGGGLLLWPGLVNGVVGAALIVATFFWHYSRDRKKTRVVARPA
jgi:TRAP transporter 4TM/12TM fusion protein